jgi:hypothetical protein
MKRSILVLSFLVLVALLAAGGASAAGTPSGANYNYQWLTDSDGDGIPNCKDPDYAPPQDGSGFQRGKVKNTTTLGEYSFRTSWNWRLALMLGPWLPKIGLGSASGFGPGDGTGNGGEGPADGTGHGPGPGDGTGDCDGGGPYGLTLRVGR